MTHRTGARKLSASCATPAAIASIASSLNGSDARPSHRRHFRTPSILLALTVVPPWMGRAGSNRLRTNGRLVELRSAARAQLVNVSHHASGDALNVRNFAAAELYCIHEASLLLFCCPLSVERTERYESNESGNAYANEVGGSSDHG
jgi:hypothetical protein